MFDLTHLPAALKLIPVKHQIPYLTLLPSTKQKAQSSPNQFVLTPDIISVIVQLIDFYEIKSSIYYIYNHPMGKLNLDSLLEHQTNHQFDGVNFIPIKVMNVKNCRNMLE